MNRGVVKGICTFCLLWIAQSSFGQAGDGLLQITFRYTANRRPLVLQDSNYINDFNEVYKVSRLKFYIGNVNLHAVANNAVSQKNIFLVDAALTDTISLSISPGRYEALQFTLGVDSVLNVSGAQDGDLDPLKGMFWTWHSGYIFFKLEGSSTASPADLHRIAHHIGGYYGVHQAQTPISLAFKQPVVVKANSHYHLNVELNLDKYWNSVNPIRIAVQPLVMAPGVMAKMCAQNFATMFLLSLPQ